MILLFLLAALSGPRRMDFSITPQAGGQVLAAVSATVAQTESVYRIEVPSGLLYATVNVGADRTRERICDVGGNDCISLGRIRGSAERPEALRVSTLTRFFWYVPEEALSDSVRLNCESIVDGLSPGFAQKLQELAVPGVADSRLAGLRDILSVVLIRRTAAVSPKSYRFQAWAAPNGWLQKFSRVSNSDPVFPAAVDAFEAAPARFLEGQLEAEIKKEQAEQ